MNQFEIDHELISIFLHQYSWYHISPIIIIVKVFRILFCCIKRENVYWSGINSQSWSNQSWIGLKLIINRFTKHLYVLATNALYYPLHIPQLLGANLVGTYVALLNTPGSIAVAYPESTGCTCPRLGTFWGNCTFEWDIFFDYMTGKNSCNFPKLHLVKSYRR